MAKLYSLPAAEIAPLILAAGRRLSPRAGATFFPPLTRIALGALPRPASRGRRRPGQLSDLCSCAPACTACRKRWRFADPGYAVGERQSISPDRPGAARSTTRSAPPSSPPGRLAFDAAGRNRGPALALLVFAIPVRSASSAASRRRARRWRSAMLMGSPALLFIGRRSCSSAAPRCWWQPAGVRCIHWTAIVLLPLIPVMLVRSGFPDRQVIAAGAVLGVGLAVAFATPALPAKGATDIAVARCSGTA